MKKQQKFKMSQNKLYQNFRSDFAEHKFIEVQISKDSSTLQP